jgi:hypothetical protein
MTHDRTDDVLNDLEAALAVTPSAGFADGVRARIRGQSARRRVWPVWAAAGLAAAAVVWLVVAVRPGSRAESPAPSAATPAVAEVHPNPRAPVASVEPAAVRPAVAREKPGVAESRASAAPVLEVISNQRDVLQRLWTRASRATPLKQEDAASPSSTPAGDTPIVSEMLTAPVTIAPVVVKPLGDGGGMPVIRRFEINAGRAR